MNSAGPNNRLTALVAKGAAFVISGNGLTILVRIAVLAVLARLVSPTDFGIMAIGTSYWSLAVLFGDSGMTQTLVQRRELTQDHISTAFAFSAATGLLFCLLTQISAQSAEAFFKTPGLAPVLRALAAVFVLQALSIVSRSLLARKIQYKTLAASDLISFAFGYGAVSIILAYFGLGVWALVWGMIAQVAIGSAICFALAPHRPSLRINRAALKDLLSSSLWFSGVGVANLIALQGPTLIVGRALGPEPLGFYSRSYQLMTIPARAFGQVAQYVMFPAMSNIQDDPVRLKRALLFATKITALLCVPVSVLIPLLSEEFVYVLLGNAWKAVVPIFGILGAGTYFRLAYKTPLLVLQAAGQVRQTAHNQLLYAATTVIGCIATVQHGLLAVSVAVVAACAVTFLHANVLAARAVKIGLFDFTRALAPGVLLSAVVGVVAWISTLLTRQHGAPLVTLGVAGVASGLVVAVLFTSKAARRYALSNE